MTDNLRQPISKIRAFAELAQKRGVYTENQRWNLETAWTILLKNISDVPGASDSTTVEQVLPLIEPTFRKYGSENRVSPSTVRAYQTRVNRLLKDFVDHYDGDFMQWKESLRRTATSTRPRKARPRRKETARPFVGQSEGDVPPILTQKHRLLLSRSREGTLALPTDLTEADIEPLWQQLDALKTLIKAQIAATRGEEEK